MPGRGSGLLVIPDSFWQRDGTVAALRARAVGQLFALVSKYTGASQTRIGIACGMSQGKVSDIVRGVQQVEALAVFERIADGLHMPDQARILLGVAPASDPSTSPRPVGVTPPPDTRPALAAAHDCGLLSLGQGDGQEDDDPVRRRTFVGLTGASLFNAMLPAVAPGSTPGGAEPLVAVLTGQTLDPAPGTLGVPPDIAALEVAVNRAREQYQACRYSELIRHLPDLLARLGAACDALDGEAQCRACALSADAHHVAAGLLLKLGDQGLAYLAADRSLRAARASEDPITVGASARIITHALMSGRHLGAAVSTASSHAVRLDRAVTRHTPDSLSVYGSLLLRRAVAAAQQGERDTAYQLLSEAEEAGRRAGCGCQ
ncbi:MAG TPA: helix-turn-helix domain-containing protein [Streptosporangiaceae bacterium]|nr:helix-turn-helix domain-containing protein [Streptosporangiaceae bacterium]